MAVKIIIMRTVSPEEYTAIGPYLTKLHALAKQQEGYISGESLSNIDNPDEKIVISSWRSKEDWERFISDPEVDAAHQAVDDLIAKKTLHQIYITG